MKKLFAFVVIGIVNVLGIYNGWTTSSVLSIARGDLFGIALENRMYFGGYNSTVLAALDILDTVSISMIKPSSNEHTSALESLRKSELLSLLTLSTARSLMTQASEGGSLVIAGGINSDGVSNLVSVFTSNSQNTFNMTVGRFHMAGSGFNGLYVFSGGRTSLATDSCHCVTTINNAVTSNGGYWEEAPITLSVARYQAVSVYVGGYLLVAGGNTAFDWTSDTGEPSSIVDIFSSTGAEVHNFMDARFRHSGAAAGIYAFFAGGVCTNGAICSSVEIFNSKESSWTITSLKYARHGLVAVSSVNNLVAFSGGYTNLGTSSPSNAVEIFDANQQTTKKALSSGDPHFFGFQGQRYDVMGQPYEIYNLVTSPALQINALFTPYYKKAGQILPTGTMMGVIGIKFGTHQFYINANSTLGELDKNPAFMENSWDIKFETATISNNVKKSYEFTIETISVTITFIRKVYIIAGLENQYHFDYRATLLNTGTELHGILGQTWDDKTIEDKIGAFRYLDGLEDDYRIKSRKIFGDDFKYNRFNEPM